VTVENETCTIDCTVPSWRAPGRPGARVKVSVTIDTLLSFLFAAVVMLIQYHKIDSVRSVQI
jgi:membrane glycosyltransferase